MAGIEKKEDFSELARTLIPEVLLAVTGCCWLLLMLLLLLPFTTFLALPWTRRPCSPRTANWTR